MKFNEKFEQIQRESDQHKLFKAFEGDIEQLISKTSHSVSFQLAYDHVFKLTKMGKQPEILNLLDDSITTFLKGKLHEDVDLEELKKELEQVREISQRISEICLFLDINYCQKVLKEPLAKRLNNDIFKTLV